MGGDLLLIGHVITMDPARPHVRAVAVRTGRVVCAGTRAACERALPQHTTVLDRGDALIVPGFVDAHLHLAAYAAALRAVDCSPARVRAIADIVDAIRARAAETPAGAWVRAAGYDEASLADGRHPTRWDLDAATAEHPVRLVHRSGHAAILNSRALALAGIDIASEEPPGAAIDRRLSDGEPTGLLLDMNDLIARVVPPLPRAELVAGMREAGIRLLAAGVTSVQDMTHTNGAAADAFLSALAAEAGFAPRLLPPAASPASVMGNGAAAPAVTREQRPDQRPVKVMLREVGERPAPDVDDLAEIIRACAARGRQVAVHAVARPAVATVVTAFERLDIDARRPALRHRIEHAGVCPPSLAARIAALGLVVVSNPGFLHAGGDRYLRRVDRADLPHLYAMGALAAAGVALAAGSDSPVAAPDPPAAIRAAATRRSASGARLPGAPLAADAALAAHTTGAAFAAHAERDVGRIAPGMRGDFAVLSGDLAERAGVRLTVIGGRIAWQAAG